MRPVLAAAAFCLQRTHLLRHAHGHSAEAKSANGPLDLGCHHEPELALISSWAPFPEAGMAPAASCDSSLKAAHARSGWVRQPISQADTSFSLSLFLCVCVCVCVCLCPISC